MCVPPINSATPPAGICRHLPPPAHAPPKLLRFQTQSNDKKTLKLPPSLEIPDIFGITDEFRIHLSSGINPGYIPDKSGILDESGIYPGYIWDISGIYLG
jgi:hypothetical protein